MISSILLNRHGSIKRALKISTSLHNKQTHQLMTGLTDLSHRNSVIIHKSQLKQIIDKAGGVLKFIQYIHSLSAPKKLLIKNY